jgi:YDG domain
VADANAAITPKSITGSFTVADKVYDGNRDATITGRSLSGQVDGDDVSLAGGSAQFDTKHAGVDKTVTGSGFALGGDAKGNYTLASVAGTKADITAKSITGSFTAADKLYDGTAVATISGRSLDGKIAGDDVTLVGGTATFEDANVGQERTVTGTGFELSGADKGNYRLASSTLTTTASIEYDWDGFLQPINDTAHQTGVNQSKFKLGQTIPTKFVIKDAFGAVVKQSSNPTFSRSGNRGACDAHLALDTLSDAVTPDAGASYSWDGSKYHYNWSTKGLAAGEYRIYANLADGTNPFVDICLTK